MIKVIENVIAKKEQENIKNLMLGKHFPWYYLNDVSLKDNPDERKPGLAHHFIFNGQPSDYFKHIENLLVKTAKKLKLKKISILQSRGFLQFPLSNNIVKDKYIDSPHLDLVEKHLVFLYYVNDGDGDTIVYKDKNLKIKKRVKPKQGRMLIFSGDYWHSGSQPTKDVRCIINTNIKI
jgi:hypothetical protein